MKTLSTLILFILVQFCLLSSVVTADNKRAINRPDAKLIRVKDQVLARKIAISLHSQLLAVDYKSGTIVTTLTDKDKALLSAYPLTIEPATEWLQQYDSFSTRIASVISGRQQSKSSNTGSIPGFSCYPTVEQTYSDAAALAASYPLLASWIDIGDSWEKATLGSGQGYDLMVLKVTNSEISEDKPILFIHSAMHAREYSPAALTLDFAKQLLSQYQSNPDYRWMIDHQEIHFLFQMNPDGRKVAESGILQRKNRNQNHCPNSTVGVDLNRNFAHFWNTTPSGSSGDACSEVFRGSAPESEPETQAVSNYIRSIFADSRGPDDSDAAPADTAGMHLDIHSYSRLVLWPYGHTSTPAPNGDAFERLGNKLAWFNQYTPTQSVGLYPTDGTSDDVSYGELGIAALTFELGNDFFEPCSNYNNSIKPDNLKALEYALRAVRAPYLLPSGPDISSLTINNMEHRVDITPSSTMTLQAIVTTSQTRQSGLSETIANVQYSIDQPIWDGAATRVSMTADDGAFNGITEAANADIDISSLSSGEHILYVNASTDSGQSGPPKAIFFNISDNASPVANFSYSCNDLSCEFDASSSTDSDGTITSYDWEFVEENQTASSQTATVSHTFPTEGTKTVILRITDNGGAKGELSKSIQITQSSNNNNPNNSDSSSTSGGGAVSIVFLLLCLSSFQNYCRRKNNETD